MPIDSCAAFLKADVGFSQDYGFAIEASVYKIGYDETRDFAVESVFEKASVRGSVEKQWGKAPEITIVKFTKFAIRMAWPSEYR